MKTVGHFILLGLLTAWVGMPATAAQEAERSTETATGTPVSRSRSAAARTKPSATVRQLRRLYKHVWLGNRKDLKTNEGLAKYFEAQAAKHKAAAASDKRKQAEYAKNAKLEQLFSQLAASNRRILRAFEGQGGDGLTVAAAMQKIPELEREITALTGKELKREWLTLSEVEERKRSSLEFRTESPDILPHAKKHWYNPEEDKRSGERSL